MHWILAALSVVLVCTIVWLYLSHWIDKHDFSQENFAQLVIPCNPVYTGTGIGMACPSFVRDLVAAANGGTDGGGGGGAAPSTTRLPTSAGAFMNQSVPSVNAAATGGNNNQGATKSTTSTKSTTAGAAGSGSGGGEPFCKGNTVTGTGNDGSKWGWENNATCRIREGNNQGGAVAGSGGNTNQGATTSTTGGEPFCKGNTVTGTGNDGSKWGWENNASCRIREGNNQAMQQPLGQPSMIRGAATVKQESEKPSLIDKFNSHVQVARDLLDVPSEPEIQSSENIQYIGNSKIQVGFEMSKGAALCSLKSIDPSKPRAQENLVNRKDNGRLVQQSYYGDADGSVWETHGPWKWNPVQGGSYQHKSSTVESKRMTQTTFTSKTIPLHWVTGALMPDVTMEQMVVIKENIVRINFTMKYTGTVTHTTRDHELPAVFLSASLGNFATGSTKFKPPPRKDKNEYTDTPERWAAFVDDNDFGVGVVFPHTNRITYYVYVDGGGEDNCSYLAPLVSNSIGPGYHLSYNVYLIVGNLDEIRSTAQHIVKNSSQN
jgi:hypothetical protein